MKAIIPEVECYKLYDKVIAKDVEAIAESSQLNKEQSSICVGMLYDESIDTKYIFQVMKIFYNCMKGSVTIYIDSNRKSFKNLVKQNDYLNLKRINCFNRKNVLYVIKPEYLKSLHKEQFSKERFYTVDLIKNIWYNYYEPKVEDKLDDI